MAIFKVHPFLPVWIKFISKCAQIHSEFTLTALFVVFFHQQINKSRDVQQVSDGNQTVSVLFIIL